MTSGSFSLFNANLSFSKGKEIVAKNDSSVRGFLHYVVEGVCCVKAEGNFVWLAAGDFFGEECFFLGSPALHAVTAHSEKVKILQFDGRKGGAFARTLMASNTLARKFMIHLAAKTLCKFLAIEQQVLSATVVRTARGDEGKDLLKLALGL